MWGVVTLHIKQKQGVSTPIIKCQARVYAENSYKCNSLLDVMRGVATLRIEQYGEYQLSTVNKSRESIKNHKYFCKIETKFEKSSDTE
jgi:hypothetical protein